MDCGDFLWRCLAALRMRRFGQRAQDQNYGQNAGPSGPANLARPDRAAMTVHIALLRI